VNDASLLSGHVGGLLLLGLEAAPALVVGRDCARGTDLQPFEELRDLLDRALDPRVVPTLYLL
jgi:hypothetical protein